MMLSEQELRDRALFWGDIFDALHITSKWLNEAAGIFITLSLILGIIECCRGLTAWRTLACLCLTFFPCIILSELMFRCAKFALWRLKYYVNQLEVRGFIPR